MDKSEGRHAPPIEEPEKPKVETPKSGESFSVEKIKRPESEKEKVEKAPEGWMTQNALVHTLGIFDRKLQKIIKLYEPTHPEWVKKFKDQGGRIYNFYHPDLVEIIKKQIIKEKPAPEGWMTQNALVHTLGIFDRKLQKIIKLYEPTHPEWVKKFKD